jgi:ribosome-associated translation inhibitor RaiA
MKLPVQVTFRHLAPTVGLDRLIHEQSAKLEVFFPQIIGCHVIVEAAHGRFPKATGYEVRIDLTVPGAELYVGREPGAPHESEDAYAAVRESFHQMRRRLQDFAARQRVTEVSSSTLLGSAEPGERDDFDALNVLQQRALEK